MFAPFSIKNSIVLRNPEATAKCKGESVPLSELTTAPFSTRNVTAFRIRSSSDKMKKTQYFFFSINNYTIQMKMKKNPVLFLVNKQLYNSSTENQERIIFKRL